MRCGDGGGQLDRVLFPVLLPGLAGVVDALSRLAHAARTLASCWSSRVRERGLSRLNGRLAAFFGGFGFDFRGFLAGLGDDLGRFAADAVEIRLADIVEMKRLAAALVRRARASRRL